MKRGFWVYTGMVSIALLSTAGATYWVAGIVRNAAGVTLFVALLGIVVQIVRDDSTYKRELEKADRADERARAAEDRALERVLAAEQRAQERAQAAEDRGARFTLGISSHMANVAFDKHVDFCDEYVKAANKALIEIFVHGPFEGAHGLGVDLMKIRTTHTLWVTKEIDERLQDFERLFLEMGSSAHFADVTRSDPRATERQDHINVMYNHLATLTGMSEWNGKKPDENKAIPATIRWLREILGIEELNAMRREFVKHAVAELDRQVDAPVASVTTQG